MAPLRLSCPHTSPQNGKAERAIRSTNTLLVQASMPYMFWVEAMHTATHLLNRRPSRAINNLTPFLLLHGAHPTYDHLRTFGCLCYPNLLATSPHKLAPRSTPCVLLGYPLEHKGYRCMDLQTRKVITSRHVIFNESVFPFSYAYPAPHPAVSGRSDTATPQSTQDAHPCKIWFLPT